jgi:hypothetical protein
VLNVITLAATLLTAWIFINTAVHKLANPTYISSVITKQMPWMNERFSYYFGIVLGVVELAVAIAILVPAARLDAALLAFSLHSLYALMMLVQLLRGRTDLDCGCAGPARRQKISRRLVLRNVILMLISGIVVYQSIAADPGLLPGQGLWMIAIPFAIFSILIYVSSEQLMSNRQKLNSLEGR